MPSVNFALVKLNLYLFASSGITCFGIGIACFSYEECGDYIPIWLVVAGISSFLYPVFYLLSAIYSKNKCLFYLFIILDGVFVLFNIFLLLVGDYTFNRFSSSCSFHSYGTGKTSFIPYISALAELIMFNFNAAFSIHSWGYMMYSLKKEGFKGSTEVQKRDETDEIRNEVPENNCV